MSEGFGFPSFGVASLQSICGPKSGLEMISGGVTEVLSNNLRSYASCHHTGLLYTLIPAMIVVPVRVYPVTPTG